MNEAARNSIMKYSNLCYQWSQLFLVSWCSIKNLKVLYILKETADHKDQVIISFKAHEEQFYWAHT